MDKKLCSEIQKPCQSMGGEELRKQIKGSVIRLKRELSE